MTSSPGTDFVTRHAFELAMVRIDARFDHLEARLDARFAQVDARIERAMVAGSRWTVGVAFGLYALMFGLILLVVSRAPPHA
jgi:hypothetical protein